MEGKVPKCQCKIFQHKSKSRDIYQVYIGCGGIRIWLDAGTISARLPLGNNAGIQYSLYWMFDMNINFLFECSYKDEICKCKISMVKEIMKGID